MYLRIGIILELDTWRLEYSVGQAIADVRAVKDQKFGDWAKVYVLSKKQVTRSAFRKARRLKMNFLAKRRRYNGSPVCEEDCAAANSRVVGKDAKEDRKWKEEDEGLARLSHPASQPASQPKERILRSNRLSTALHVVTARSLAPSPLASPGERHFYQSSITQDEEEEEEEEEEDEENLNPCSTVPR
ncbi:hypothetical protein WH47_00303 [Habropoda laboriosa]|uniref:Uncharacterized protein n=1 Tax=Habropoda laboriosa TaxID=597456 RepID=A0A0L7R1R0_9HYME|nr:hypothetical protein WH47_00303 [Habropoda laboriosa]